MTKFPDGGSKVGEFLSNNDEILQKLVSDTENAKFLVVGGPKSSFDDCGNRVMILNDGYINEQYSGPQ